MTRIIFIFLLCVIYVTSSANDDSKEWTDSRLKSFAKKDESSRTKSITMLKTSVTETATSMPTTSTLTPTISVTPATTATTQTTPTTTPLPLESYCKAAGYQCAGCEKVIFCYKQDGIWYVIDFETCKSPDETCDKGSCTTVPNRECLKDPYKCQQTEGMYPDPSSCKKFKYCVPESPGSKTLKLFTSSCSSDYAYNAGTTYCDKPIPNNMCNGYPVPECTQPAQTEALKENPTIYYICLPVAPGSKLLYPFLEACPNGKKYNAHTSICE